MVDRTTMPEQQSAMAQRYGVDDNWPVIIEAFSQ